MANLTSATYYRTREARERALADAATDPSVRLIHLEMAGLYAQIVTEYPALDEASAHSSALPH